MSDQPLQIEEDAELEDRVDALISELEAACADVEERARQLDDPDEAASEDIAIDPGAVLSDHGEIETPADPEPEDASEPEPEPEPEPDSEAEAEPDPEADAAPKAEPESEAEAESSDVEPEGEPEDIEPMPETAEVTANLTDELGDQVDDLLNALEETFEPADSAVEDPVEITPNVELESEASDSDEPAAIPDVQAIPEDEAEPVVTADDDEPGDIEDLDRELAAITETMLDDDPVLAAEESAEPVAAMSDVSEPAPAVSTRAEPIDTPPPPAAAEPAPESVGEQPQEPAPTSGAPEAAEPADPDGDDALVITAPAWMSGRWAWMVPAWLWIRRAWPPAKAWTIATSKKLAIASAPHVLRGLEAASKPLEDKGKLKDTVGWLAAYTAFLAIAVLAYAIFFRDAPPPATESPPAELVTPSTMPSASG